MESAAPVDEGGQEVIEALVHDCRPSKASRADAWTDDEGPRPPSVDALQPFLGAADAVAKGLERAGHRARVLWWMEGEGKYAQPVGALEVWLDRGAGFRGGRFVIDRSVHARISHDGVAHLTVGNTHRSSRVDASTASDWLPILAQAIRDALPS